MSQASAPPPYASAPPAYAQASVPSQEYSQPQQVYVVHAQPVQAHSVQGVPAHNNGVYYPQQGQNVQYVQHDRGPAGIHYENERYCGPISCCIAIGLLLLFWPAALCVRPTLRNPLPLAHVDRARAVHRYRCAPAIRDKERATDFPASKYYRCDQGSRRFVAGGPRLSSGPGRFHGSVVLRNSRAGSLPALTTLATSGACESGPASSKACSLRVSVKELSDNKNPAVDRGKHSPERALPFHFTQTQGVCPDEYLNYFDDCAAAESAVPGSALRAHQRRQ